MAIGTTGAALRNMFSSEYCEAAGSKKRGRKKNREGLVRIVHERTNEGNKVLHVHSILSHTKPRGSGSCYMSSEVIRFC